MKHRVVDSNRNLLRAGSLALLLTLLAGSSVQAQRLANDRYKNGVRIRSAFRKVVAKANLSTIAVYSDGKHVAMGTVVGADGEVLTKASELTGKLTVKLRDGRTVNARIQGIARQDDLALLKIEADKLSPIALAKRTDPTVGRWLATPGMKDVPISVGVMSVRRRRLSSPRPLFGVLIENSDGGGAAVKQVTPGSGADKAGVKAGDVIVRVADVAVKVRDDVAATVRKYQPGITLDVEVRRKDAAMALRVTLGAFQRNPNDRFSIEKRMGGALSKRSAGFPSVFQHDAYLRPQDCGGPIVDLKGNVVGINIARAGRTVSYAVPIDRVIALLPNLRSEERDSAKAKPSRRR